MGVEDKKVEAAGSSGGALTRPEYKTPPGPQENRKCHDIFFLILFVLFWMGMIAIGIIAMQKGNLDRLKYGNDTDGNLCGVDNKGDSALGIPPRDNSAAKLLYYFTPIPGVISVRKCISSCPKVTGDRICYYNITDPNVLPPQEFFELVAVGYCTFTIATTPLLNRCIPNMTVEALGTNATTAAIASLAGIFVTDVNARTLATQIYSGMSAAFPTIAICAGIAVGISFVWLFLIQLFAAPVVWLTVILTILSSWGGAAYFWFNWNATRLNKETILPSSSFETVNTALQNEQTLLAIAIIGTVVAVGLTFLLIFARSRISLAISIIQEASRAVRAMPMIVVFPLLKYILLVGLVVWCLYIFAMLSTSGSTIAKSVSDAGNNSTSLALLNSKLNGTAIKPFSFSPDTTLHWLELYYVFGFFWSWQMIIAVGQCTVAGSIACWYWTRDKKALPVGVVFRSLIRVLRYHLGSLALGSLIIALVQTIRVVLQYMQNRLKASKNKVVLMILRCLDCCFACVEKFLKFISKNAYVEIAVYGYSFCDGAKQAWNLLTRNAFRVMVIDRVADFLLFLGKLTIACITGWIGMVMLQKDADVGSFYALPVLVIFFLGWSIASCFTSVLGMAIDTIFLCFCEDAERHDGSPGKEYFMSDSLKAFTDKHKTEPAKM
jgi:hypothetical protein